MKKKSVFIVIVLALLVLGSIGIYALSQGNVNSNANDSMLKTEDGAMEKMTDDIMIKEETVMEKTSGSYIEYSGNLLTESQNVIFFAASWCPTCRSLDRSINSELTSIPSNLTILKADYDLETTLKQKYGVTYQHTLVQVDSKGNMLKKWNGSNDISEIVDQLV